MHRELIKLLSVLILHDVSPCEVIPCHNVTPTRKAEKQEIYYFITYIMGGWVEGGGGGGDQKE